MTPKRITGFAFFIRDAIEKGFLLFFAAFFAVVVSNLSYGQGYLEFFDTDVALHFGAQSFRLTVRDWINDLLMAIFFFVVGMEIKRELLVGRLSRRDQRVLPFAAAVGGVVVPAVIFILFNKAYALNMRGWAIPTATDIAFALGALTLVAKNLPSSLRVFLTALAIIDDLIAILIIALCYTETLQLNYIAYAAMGLLFVIGLNRWRASSGLVYVFVGIFMWCCIMASGVHATITGVILGLSVPLHSKGERKLMKEFESFLHPLVHYLIMPLFALANSGIDLTGVGLGVLANPVMLGIACGLFFGKQLGVFGVLFALVKTKVCRMPEGATFKQCYGVSVMCGIGFTMSLFIGALAFSAVQSNVTDYDMVVKLGVLGGSLLSFVLGAIVLKIFRSKGQHD